VRNFLMWGFWDGAHWHQDAPIFNDDWSLKPSGEAFIEWVFEKWWTSESGMTKRDGQFQTRAFYGAYDIDVEFDGQKEKVSVQFSKDSGDIEIQLNTIETSLKQPTEIPANFELAGNYPNPFNPRTTIRYALPRRTDVELQVYDVGGRLVFTLVNESRNAGRHSVVFDGTGQASGTYIVRMKAGGFVGLSKMLMIK